MVAPGLVGVGAVAVPSGFAAELTAPDDEGGVEETALLEVGEEGRERAVDFTGLGAHAGVDVLVMVPTGVPDLHHAHATLDEAAGDEELFALLVATAGGDAVGGARGLGFLVDVEGVERLGLHAERNLVALEAGLERGVALEVLRVELVELVNEIHLPALLVL